MSSHEPEICVRSRSNHHPTTTIVVDNNESAQSEFDHVKSFCTRRDEQPAISDLDQHRFRLGMIGWEVVCKVQVGVATPFDPLSNTL
jgi:hypothetical protein